MTEEDNRHVQVSFFSQGEPIPGTEDAVIDVPITGDWDNLNGLVNKLAAASDDAWKTKRFELLIGNTFLRSTLSEFIEENHVDIERVVRIECVSGYEPPKPHLSLTGPDWISTVHVTDKLYIATSYNGEITVWDRKGEKVSTSVREPGAIKAACVLHAPNKAGTAGLKMATGGETAVVWIQEWDKEGKATPVTALRGHARSVEAIQVGVNGTRLLSGGFDCTLKVWNMEADDSDVHEVPSGKETKRKKEEHSVVTKVPMVTLASHSDAVVSIQWSPLSPGKAFTASWDHSILEWDLELAGEVSRIRTARAFTGIDAHDKSGLLIASLTDAVPRLFDPRSSEGAYVKQSFVGHRGWVSAVKWTRRDDFSFVSSSFDGTVKMWDIRSAKTSVFDLSGHDDRVLCVGVGHDSILSGGVDAKVNIFSF